MLGPFFFFFTRTERPDRTARPNGAQIKSRLTEIDLTTVDGGGHYLRTNTLLLCRDMCQKFPFVLTWLARTSILHGPKHGSLHRNGTNDRMNSLVPGRSVLQGRTGLRNAFFEHITCMIYMTRQFQLMFAIPADMCMWLLLLLMLTAVLRL